MRWTGCCVAQPSAELQRRPPDFLTFRYGFDWQTAYRRFKSVRMNKILLIAILVVMLAVVFVLARGIGSFGKGGADGARKSNRMMWWRIGLQALAIALIFILVTLAGRG